MEERAPVLLGSAAVVVMALVTLEATALGMGLGKAVAEERARAVEERVEVGVSVGGERAQGASG